MIVPSASSSTIRFDPSVSRFAGSRGVISVWSFDMQKENSVESILRDVLSRGVLWLDCGRGFLVLNINHEEVGIAIGTDVGLGFAHPNGRYRI